MGLYTGCGLVKDGEAFYRSIVKTEASFITTGIGLGIAMPQGRAQDLEEDVVPAIAISKQGLDYEALDNKPVKIIFLTVSKTPVKDSGVKGVILKFLAGVARFLKSPEVRETLINATSREEVFQYIKEKFLPLSGL